MTDIFRPTALAAAASLAFAAPAFADNDLVTVVTS